MFTKTLFDCHRKESFLFFWDLQGSLQYAGRSRVSRITLGNMVACYTRTTVYPRKFHHSDWWWNFLWNQPFRHQIPGPQDIGTPGLPPFPKVPHPLSYTQGFIQDFFLGREHLCAGKLISCGHRPQPPWGVWGHAPPEKFWTFKPSESDLRPSTD